MTIHQLINLANKKLSKVSTSPSLDGEVLLSYLLAKPKEYLLINPQKKVDTKIEKKFLTFVNRRLLGWPVAYLTKQKEFFKINFYVDKKVLIPRPETEGLVELAIKKIKDLRLKIKEKRSLDILDIGTGSGNIILALAKNLNPKIYNVNFFASDISPKAISVAKKNAKLLKVKITFGDGNLLEPWANQNFDVIVANLPYLAKLVDPSTRFEPVGALFAAKKGLKLYEELFRQVRLLKLKPRYLFLEIGRDQGHPIKKLADKLMPVYKISIFRDLYGRQRYAELVLKPS